MTSARARQIYLSPCAERAFLGCVPLGAVAPVHLVCLSRVGVSSLVCVRRKQGQRWAGGRRAKMGRGPEPAPRWVGNIIAAILLRLGPKGLEFGRYSIDYHYIRNFLYVTRNWPAARASEHVPEFARRLVAMYDRDGAISAR
jgi:hypothetical protein